MKTFKPGDMMLVEYINTMGTGVSITGMCLDEHCSPVANLPRHGARIISEGRIMSFTAYVLDEYATKLF